MEGANGQLQTKYQKIATEYSKVRHSLVRRKGIFFCVYDISSAPPLCAILCRPYALSISLVVA